MRENVARDLRSYAAAVDGRAAQDAPREAPPVSDVVATHEFIRVPFGGPRLSVQTTVIGPSRVFRVHGPFTVSLEYSADGVFASHASLPVHGYGRSIKEALAGFDESFEFQWSCLVEREPADLTEHARELRQRMERAVVSVGPRT